jgi:hypothetical protein
MQPLTLTAAFNLRLHHTGFIIRILYQDLPEERTALNFTCENLQR